MKITKQLLSQYTEESQDRLDLWIRIINLLQIKSMAEIGVYRGDFACQILQDCESIEKYFMVDPWRNLEDWNKPANKNDNVFEKFYLETKEKTDFAKDKIIILRGKTTEVSDDIPDDSLDFAYIDGDHTLKGITIDLTCLFAKIKPGGYIGGDDFSKSIWQHTPNYEPTLVFPFAVYFAEAVGATIYALPYSQFLIEKTTTRAFSFVDLTGKYNKLRLQSQLNPIEIIKAKTMDVSDLVTKYIR